MPPRMLPDADRSLLFTPQALPSACTPRPQRPARRTPAGRCPTPTRAPSRRLPRSCAVLRGTTHRRPPSGLRLQETGASPPHLLLVLPGAPAGQVLPCASVPELPDFSLRARTASTSSRPVCPGSSPFWGEDDYL